MTVRYEVDYGDLQRLHEVIGRLPNKSEETINKVLKKSGGKLIASNITTLIPVSKPHDAHKGKIHAAQVKWSTQENENLSVSVKSAGGAAKNKGSFGYLVFPNEGRGSKNKHAQYFMEDGLEDATPGVIEMLESELVKKIEEEL